MWRIAGNQTLKLENICVYSAFWIWVNYTRHFETTCRFLRWIADTRSDHLIEFKWEMKINNWHTIFCSLGWTNTVFRICDRSIERSIINQDDFSDALLPLHLVSHLKPRTDRLRRNFSSPKQMLSISVAVVKLPNLRILWWSFIPTHNMEACFIVIILVY